MDATRREILTGERWGGFIESERAALTLGRTDCAPCLAFDAALVELLANDDAWPDVRFGKILLDTRGFHLFKKQNPWLRHADVLPVHILYARGEALERFTGDLDVLRERMRAAWPQSETR
jgi:uncharacterized protein CbrC (UPF0167 family)